MFVSRDAVDSPLCTGVDYLKGNGNMLAGVLAISPFDAETSSW